MKRFLGLTLCAVMMLGAVGCGGSADGENGEVSTETAAAEGETEGSGEELVIGLDDTFAPMGFRDENNELVGFDIDLANAAADIMGVKAVFQPIDWDTKETELETGKIDLIWNGFSYSDERNESMTLSKAYLDNKQVIIVPADSEIGVKADLAGKKVGLQDGSTAADAVEADPIASEIDEISTYDTNDLAFTDLSAGRIDAVVADVVLATYYIETSGADFKILDEDFGSEQYVIAAKKGNTELMDKLEAALDELGTNGKGEEISNKWFNENIYIH